jgi:hypothetical protein
MHNNLAKSLPVNVPAFLPENKKLSDERDDERVSDFPGLKLLLRRKFVETCVLVAISHHVILYINGSI